MSKEQSFGKDLNSKQKRSKDVKSQRRAKRSLKRNWD